MLACSSVHDRFAGYSKVNTLRRYPILGNIPGDSGLCPVYSVLVRGIPCYMPPIREHNDRDADS